MHASFKLDPAQSASVFELRASHSRAAVVFVVGPDAAPVQVEGTFRERGRGRGGGSERRVLCNWVAARCHALRAEARRGPLSTVSVLAGIVAAPHLEDGLV